MGEKKRQLELRWSKPIAIGSKNGFLSTDLTKVPETKGIYIFGRKFGKSFEALYVGLATGSIRSRVKKQFNNHKLMRHLEDAAIGERVLLAGEFLNRPGQNPKKHLPIVERALIRHFVGEGHDLVNQQGTHLRGFTVVSVGRHPKRWFDKAIYLEK